MLLRLDRLPATLTRDERDRRIGKKAASLADLTALGLPVPPACCLPATAFPEFLSHNGIAPDHEALQRLGRTDTAAATEALDAVARRIRAGRLAPDHRAELAEFLAGSGAAAFAVRSSGLKEDLSDASFAGLYHTTLGAGGIDAVEDAVKGCWASLYTPRVLTYFLHRGIPYAEIGMAVIVQTMIPADRSGVIFTVNPLTGNDTEMLIEACLGLGEALVGGEIDPDQYRYDWFAEAERERRISVQKTAVVAESDGRGVGRIALSRDRQREPVLSPAEVADLARIALRVQTAYGYPVDIEWVARDGAFFLVQARPITRIGLEGVRGQWTTADFKDGGVSSGVCSPMMWSLYDFIWERAMPAYLLATRVLDREIDEPLGDMFFGRPYWNAGAIKACARKIPGFVERAFDEDLGIAVGYAGEGAVTRMTPSTVLRGLKVLGALKRSFAEREKASPRAVEAGLARVAELDAVDPAAVPDAELPAFFKELIRRDYWNVESAYFTHIYDNSNVQTLFKQAVRRYEGKADFLSLTIGLKDLSHMRPNLELFALSRELRASGEAMALLAGSDEAALASLLRSDAPPACLAGVRVLIEKYQYHSTRELDITVPNYREDPSFLLANLRRLVALDDGADPATLNAEQHRRYEAERAKLLASVPVTKRRGMERRLEQMRRFLWWREELRDVSTRMYDQIRRFSLEVGRRLAARGAFCRQDDVFFLAVDDLIALLEGTLPEAEARRSVDRNRAYYESFRGFANPPDIGFLVRDEAEPPEGGLLLKGIASSPGVVEGRVKVIADVVEARRLARGDILVTRFTDPGWTPVFGLIAGVVTETGGVLSHAAVISREYGIPAVLGIRNATRRIRDGERIRVDGKAGTVRLLERE